MKQQYQTATAFIDCHKKEHVHIKIIKSITNEIHLYIWDFIECLECYVK